MANTELLKLTGKTVDEVFHILPKLGYKKLFTEWCGMYYPDRDKEMYGDLIVMAVIEYTPTVLYVGSK